MRSKGDQSVATKQITCHVAGLFSGIEISSDFDFSIKIERRKNWSKRIFFASIGKKTLIMCIIDKTTSTKSLCRLKACLFFL